MRVEAFRSCSFEDTISRRGDRQFIRRVIDGSGVCVVPEGTLEYLNRSWSQHSNTPTSAKAALVGDPGDVRGCDCAARRAGLIGSRSWLEWGARVVRAGATDFESVGVQEPTHSKDRNEWGTRHSARWEA